MKGFFYWLKIRMLLATNPVAFFETLNQLDWYQQTLQNWVARNNVSHGSQILEVGCATGTLSRHLVNLKHDLTAVDLSEKMINVAQSQNPDIPFYVADVKKLPFERESFDSVICASLLNIVSDREKALSEMIRVCKPGGEISVLVPLMGFNDEKLNALKSSLRVTGFSLAALKSWHQLAPKMTVSQVDTLFSQFGLQAKQPETYLDGMVFSMSAIKDT